MPSLRLIKCIPQRPDHWLLTAHSCRCVLPEDYPGQQGTALPKVMPSPGGWPMAHQCRDRKAWLPCLSLAQFPRSRAPGLVVASIMYQFSPLSSRAFLASLQGCLQRPQPDKCMHLRVTFQGALSKKCSYPVWIKPTVNPEEKGNGVAFRWEH